ncbi:MAG: ferrous iron transport protein A [Clostridiaceae bacterium]|nr:ferrous iron transport protein A [Clostridiaceae bacterium]HPU45077.1 FeoA family protein [Thermoclostridium sp.]
MPLTMVKEGEERLIRKISGKAEIKKFLESLGFVVGGTVTVINEIAGNVIVNVKNSRVAISREMACRILV